MTSPDYIAVTETHAHSTRPLTVGAVGSRDECERFAVRQSNLPVGIPSEGRTYTVEPTAGRRSAANNELRPGDRVYRMSHLATI